LSVDRNKVMAAAQKHLEKSAFDKAIVEFQKLVKADPSDVRTWLKIGDLYVKLNQRPQAIDTYTKVAEQYAGQGFFHKAVAVYKQILNLDGTRLDVKLRLAEMNESMQLTSEAMQIYEQVASEYGRLGDADKVVTTFGKMVQIDPNNIPTRIKYAEALSRAGKKEEAAEAFEAGAELLKTQGRLDDYVKVVERLLFHKDDIERSRELAQYYLERNDGKRALAKLQVLFKADPHHIPTLELLATAFEQVQQLPKTISVLREVARLHGERNASDERARVLKRIVTLDPGDAEARQALAQLAGPVQPPAPVKQNLAPPPGAVIGARAPTVVEPEEAEELLDEDDDFDDVEDVEEGSSATLDGDGGVVSPEDPAPEDEDDVVIVDEEEPVYEPEEEQPPTRNSYVPQDVQKDASIAKLLTEVEVFQRYGLKQKVVEQLRHILSIEPRNVEARERLKETLISRGEHAAAAQDLVFLADMFYRDDPPRALAYLREANELDPTSMEVQGRLAALEPPPPAPAPVAPSGREETGRIATGREETGRINTGREQTGRIATGFARGPLPAPAKPLAALPKPGLPKPGLAPAALPNRAGPPAVRPSAVVAPTPRAEPVAGVKKKSERPPSMRPPEDEDGIFFVDDGTDASQGTSPNMSMAELAQEPQAPITEPPQSAEEHGEAEPEAENATFETVGVTSPSEPLPSVDPLAPISPEEFESVPLRPSMIDLEQPAAQVSSGEVEEILDEAEFFVAQGLFEECLGVLRDALSTHPTNRLLLDKIAEVEEQHARASAALKAASVAPPSVDNSFELASKLADEVSAEASAEGSDVLDVEAVFAQFKKGVEQQIGAEDTDTHFDLGIAYKEMGLLNDAIREFALCATNPHRECMANTMIGVCHQERGDVSAAIGAYKKALYAEHKTDREELGLYFELGKAYELVRDPQEALYYYEKVKKRDPKFMQVDDRIRALTQPQQAAPAPTEGGDLDAAFDELLGKE
jgi:tetratricopeptide (TPR) repeat protein